MSKLVLEVASDPKVNIGNVGIWSVGWKPRKQVGGPLNAVLLPNVNRSTVVRACGGYPVILYRLGGVLSTSEGRKSYKKSSKEDK